MHNFESSKAGAQRATVEEHRLPTRRGKMPRFLFAHSPMSWEFSTDRDRWLPRLKQIPLTPGANGVRAGRTGHHGLMTRLRADGWTVIDDDAPVVFHGDDGEIVEDTGYMLRYEGTRGPAYADVWSRPVVFGVGRSSSVDWGSQYDAAGFEAWRALLVDNGTIAAPAPAVLARLIEGQRSRAGRRLSEAHDGNPHVQSIVEDQHKRLADMTAAAERHSVRPKRKRRQSRASGKKAAASE